MLVKFQKCTKLRSEFYIFWTLKSSSLCQNLTSDKPVLSEVVFSHAVVHRVLLIDIIIYIWYIFFKVIVYFKKFKLLEVLL